MTKRRRWNHLPQEVRREVIRLAAKGWTRKQILSEVDISNGSITNVLKPLGGVVKPDLWRPCERRLSLDQRIEILLGLERRMSLRAIAAAVGCHASTVCREVNANGGRHAYRPIDAHHRAWRLARRPKQTKLAGNATLCGRVKSDLEQLWSPDQIARRLRSEFADQPELWVSHETIYKSLYVQGRGELRRELARCLRTGRAKRKSPGRIERRGKTADMVLISERPAEVEDRAVPGHWEGDLIFGKNQKSAIGTLVERATRYVMLLHLPNGCTAEEVRKAMARTVMTLPESLRRSITWDQGSELRQHVTFTVDTGVQVYFCDPYSPWQRGSNENTNGLLRQYFPKGTDLSIHDEQKLREVADSLNGRPRKTLGYMTPAEKLAEFVASTG